MLGIFSSWNYTSKIEDLLNDLVYTVKKRRESVLLTQHLNCYNEHTPLSLLLLITFNKKCWPNFGVNTSHYEVACLVLLCLCAARVAEARASSELCDVWRRCTKSWPVWWASCRPTPPCHDPTWAVPFTRSPAPCSTGMLQWKNKHLFLVESQKGSLPCVTKAALRSEGGQGCGMRGWNARLQKWIIPPHSFQ